MYRHSQETFEVDNYHVDLIKEVFEKLDIPFEGDCLSEPHVHFNGPQVVIYQSYVNGPGEVDTLSIVAFYIPHDGQCTIAINHMDGLVTLDNAGLMFPQKEEATE